jgi:hypothetical protein
VVAIDTRQGRLRATLRYIDTLYWTHTKGLLFAEGGDIQRLIGPGLLHVSSERCSAYAPRPHLTNVVLATVHEAPESMDLLGVFADLRRLSG